MLEGLPPNNAAHVVRLACDEATARAVADIIVETFDPAETAAAAFEAEPNAASWSSPDWTVEVFFGHPPDEAMVRSLVAATVSPEAAQALRFEKLEDRDWIRLSQDGLPAVRAGRFLVYAAHTRDRLRANDVGLAIEAALAFGTGHHGTTRGCLLVLGDILRRRRPKRVLDVGTGTGVLAIAAAKMLHRPVAAGDIDAIAVATARQNALDNGVGRFVRPVVARGVRHPRLESGAPYDLIFANILARPLRLLAPSLAAVARPTAELVLSGLLAPDAAGVLSAFRAQGFGLARRIDLEGWATLLLRRGGAASRPAPC